MFHYIIPLFCTMLHQVPKHDASSKPQVAEPPFQRQLKPLRRPHPKAGSSCYEASAGRVFILIILSTQDCRLVGIFYQQGLSECHPLYNLATSRATKIHYFLSTLIEP